MSYRELWQRALPYLGVRQNDEHTRYSFRFAEPLAARCGARAEVVLPAIILHDVGWSTVPEDQIPESFGPRLRNPELRRQHIDGHDTRAEALSIDDAVVKDADKLWLFTPFGFDTVRGWFGFSVAEQLAYLEELARARLHTEPGRHMATGLLVALRALHQPGAPA